MASLVQRRSAVVEPDWAQLTCQDPSAAVSRTQEPQDMLKTSSRNQVEERIQRFTFYKHVHNHLENNEQIIHEIIFFTFNSNF